MRPIDKTSEDLFQKLRNRFSPISMGDETANETANPTDARIFNFMYKENEHDIGYVSISIINNRSFKVYYGTDVVEQVENKANWYNFLRELRMFAKRNLMSFDARDLAKNQLEPRDFKFISNQDGTYKEKDVNVSESVMFGSRRKSYQAMESVKIIVNHRKSIDETIPGSRSRFIESIYLERSDGERYKFPYNYLTGARAMACHVAEGGNPYDDMGKHIVGMIKEMRDLSKFARRTKKYAMEDEQADTIRNHVVERFQNLKKQLGAMSIRENYARFVENFKKTEDASDGVEQLKERFTQRVFDAQLEDTLPAVTRAIKEAEMRQLAEADKSIGNLVKNLTLVLRKDDSADEMFRNTKFTNGSGLLSYILSDIASRAIGDNADVIANFASDASERVNDKDYDTNDKKTALMLAKHYMDDVKKMASDPSYAEQVRVNSSDVYGAKKKRSGGQHETNEYESWANDLVPEAAPTGTVGTQGTQAPANIGQAMRDPKLQQAARNVSRVAQAAGIKVPPTQVAQGMAAQATGKPMPRSGAMTTFGLGNAIQSAAADPRKAAQLTAMMKKMVTAGKFDEDAVRQVLEEPNTTTVYKTPGTTPPTRVSSVINDPKNQSSTAFKVPGSTPAPASKLSGANALKALSVGLGPKGDLEPGAMGKVTLPVQPLKQFDNTQSAMPDMDAMVGQEKAAAVAQRSAQAVKGGGMSFNPSLPKAAPKTMPGGQGTPTTNFGQQAALAKTAGAQAAKIGQGAGTVGGMTTTPPPPKSGTVSAGGNVWNMYKQQFGKAPTPADLARIAKASGIKDINKVMPGQQIKWESVAPPKKKLIDDFSDWISNFNPISSAGPGSDKPIGKPGLPPIRQGSNIDYSRLPKNPTDWDEIGAGIMNTDTYKKLPLNIRNLGQLATGLPVGAGKDLNYFSPEDQKALADVAGRAHQRLGGKLNPDEKYFGASDQDYAAAQGTPKKIDPDVDWSTAAKTANLAKRTLTDPEFAVQTGQGQYSFRPNAKGLNVVDKYNFVKQSDREGSNQLTGNPNYDKVGTSLKDLAAGDLLNWRKWAEIADMNYGDDRYDYDARKTDVNIPWDKLRDHPYWGPEAEKAIAKNLAAIPSKSGMTFTGNIPKNTPSQTKTIPSNTGVAKADIPPGAYSNTPPAPVRPTTATVGQGSSAWKEFQKAFGRSPTKSELNTIAQSSGIKNISKIMPGQKLDFSKIK